MQSERSKTTETGGGDDDGLRLLGKQGGHTLVQFNR